MPQKLKTIPQYKDFNRINMTFYKLGGAGPVKNRPSTDQLNRFAKKEKEKKKCDT